MSIVTLICEWPSRSCTTFGCTPAGHREQGRRTLNLDVVFLGEGRLRLDSYSGCVYCEEVPLDGRFHKDGTVNAADASILAADWTAT